MFGNLGAGEIILILLVILILFGAKKIPELAKGLGKGMSEFKKGLKDVESEIKDADKDSNKIDDKKSWINLNIQSRLAVSFYGTGFLMLQINLTILTLF